VAVNVCEVPRAMVGLVGVTAIETSVAGATISVVVKKIPLYKAVIVVNPVPTAKANPFEPAALLIVATEVDDEPHSADAVRSCVVPSE
jgi:hypothetical protein